MARQQQNAEETDAPAERLMLSAELEDGRVPGLFANLTYLLAAVLAGVILWASFAEIREVALGQGEIVPGKRVQLVQHLEGGEIADVLVEEGQTVRAGQGLVRLSPVAAGSDLAQLRVRAASLRLRTAALGAMIEGGDSDLATVAPDHPGLTRQEGQYLDARRDQIREEQRTLEARLTREQAALDAAIRMAESQARQVGILQERLEIQENLVESGNVARSLVLETRARVEDARAEGFAAIGRREAAREQLAEARSALAANRAETLRILGEERVTAAADLAEIEEQIAKAADRFERLLVKSPANGIVQELAQKTAGEVVRAGDLVARIVPVGTTMVAEVRLDPIDVGHVSEGDPVEVTLTTFDPNVFGVLEGRVDVISPTTFQDADGISYYKVQVALDAAHVGSGVKHRALQPGMVVEARILTGTKSLMRYLLKPVYRSLDIGFTER